tara:strand:- start:115 stop:543 length:429 start_codon:yes stop_codon:yes gene_type:complete
MMRFTGLPLILLILTSLTGCETRSKLVAKNIYNQPSIQLTLECKNSIKTVETRQLAKNSSLALMPIAAILTGGVSVIAAAAVNGGITLDDELNANRIAKTCEMQQHFKTNSDILLTMAVNSTVNAITGSVNIVNAPIQPTIE